MTIKRYAAERKIQFLVHFTRIENVVSILDRGLYPRNQCAKLGINSMKNDAYRHDHTDAICASIGFPNYKMFFALQKESPNLQWAIIGLKPDVLWLKDCSFCKANAASSSVSSIPIDDRKGVAALSAMYEDFEGKERCKLDIPMCYPTNPQAEVLIHDHVEPELLLGVAFNDKALASEFAARYDGLSFIFEPSFFKWRSDYMHWRRNG